MFISFAQREKKAKKVGESLLIQDCLLKISSFFLLHFACTIVLLDIDLIQSLKMLTIYGPVHFPVVKYNLFVGFFIFRVPKKFFAL